MSEHPCTVFENGDLILEGKYLVERCLGRGAFAEVYLVTHVALNAPRAVKVLHRRAPGVGSTDMHIYHQRFTLEAQLGARLDHPNIIRVYDFIAEGDEALYLVMEYAPGGSLYQRLEAVRDGKRPRLSVEEVVGLGLDVARGLAALHERQIVHRDLKPSNILFDGEGRAKIGDLGLAQVPGGPSMRSQVSEPEPHPGTPAYMSPEQMDTYGYLPPASDVYALGAVLFEALTGKVYRGVRPGTRVRDLREDMPEWLDDLIMRMLARDPQERPWDGDEVVRLLEEGVRGEAEHERREKVARLREEAEAALRAGEWARLEEAVRALAALDEDAARPYEEALERYRQEERRKQREAKPKPRLQAGTGVTGRRWVLPFVGALALLMGVGLTLWALFGRGGAPGAEPPTPAPQIAAVPTTRFAPSPSPTPTLVPASPTPTRTSTPTWTPMPSPTSVPTPEPVREGTPVPLSGLPITVANAERVTQLARWGKGRIREIAYSPDGRLLAVGTSIGVHLYDAATFREVRYLETPAVVTSVAFSPDGVLLASGSEDETVRLWRVADGSLVRTLEGHESDVESVAFSPDGALLASGSDDNTVRLWRVKDGSLVRTLEGHTGGVWSVAFSPDGGLLASGSWDGTVRLWGVPK